MHRKNRGKYKTAKVLLKIGYSSGYVIFTSLFSCFLNGADNGVRTHDLHVGNVMLYQLSYIRIDMVEAAGIEPASRTAKIKVIHRHS